MKQRLIDANALREKWLCLQGHDFSPSSFVYSIDNAPTVDAVPVRHGSWRMDEDPHDGDCRCTACGICNDAMHERNHDLLNALTGNKWWTFYHCCPNCGAKMDGERKEKDDEQIH